MEQATHKDRLLGAKVGNYEVVQKLGEGGMGAVYLAVHPNIGKRVALKVLHPEFSSNEDVIARFFTEAKAVNDIQHPNIVDIIDYGEMPPVGGMGQKVVYFIMEFLPGDSLAKLIHEQAPLSAERAQAISAQIADALGASHRQGIVHRDLKPDNVMVTVRRDGRDFVKVLDFGIAKLTGDQPGSRRTRTGIVMGTPAYMSPEQCEGRGLVDHRTDIYSLGVMLYEMLTSQVPFRGEGYGEVLIQHLTHLPRMPSAIRPAIPLHLELICLKALEKRPAERFGDMEQFLLALQDPAGFVEAHGGAEGFLTYGRNRSGHEQIGYFPMPGSAPGAGYTGPTAPTSLTPPPYPNLPADVLRTTPMAGNAAAGSGLRTPHAPGANWGSGAHPGGQVAATPAHPTPPPPNQARRSVGLKIGLVALAAIGLGVTAFFAYRAAVGGGRPLADRSPRAGSSSSATPPSPAPTPPAPIQAPAPVDIAVTTTPPGANVFVGAETEPRGTTPLSLTFERGEAPVELVLKAEGFEDKRQSVVPSQNRVLDLVLVAVAAKADERKAADDERDEKQRRSRERDRSRREERDGERRHKRDRAKVGDDVIRPEF